MQTTPPIDIASTCSPSPVRFQPARTADVAAIMGAAFDANMGHNRQDSFDKSKPITMKNPNRDQTGRPRRESLAGSLVGGMSWGGVSVGSWIRDDIIMTGTSPFPYQSPSYHSSSYLPKLEANFMKDFSCCGRTLPTLHDLLQHYEECHAQQTPQSIRSVQLPPGRNDKPGMGGPSNTQQSGDKQLSNGSRTPVQMSKVPNGGQAIGGIHMMRQQQEGRQPPQPTDDDMEVENMEMDDAIGPMESDLTTPNQANVSAQKSYFGQRPSLNLNGVGGMPHQGLRNSQPTTPASAGFGFQNNPTVSSVNTPTLSAQPKQNAGFAEASVPGTPAEADDEYAGMPMNMNLNMMNMGAPNWDQSQFAALGNADLGLDMYIDEPAKRLFSPNGGINQRALQQQFAQFGLNGQNQLGVNNEVLRQLQRQQLLALQGNAGLMIPVEEPKQFRCPVIGCEKAYKNQNGLKYHKAHGHQTQQLHENGDGTFSIVNPETSTPYPGTLGMEKEKPYKCDVCGKRYKNLNGLKYHRQHSAPCNPELKLNNHLQLGALGALGVNVAGLPGIGEEPMM